MKKLEATIGYEFRDPSLLETALTHSSYVNEHALKKTDCNERLEFLGDAVLETVSSRYLFRAHPDLMEGQLSKRRSALVSEGSLAEAARLIDLGSYLKLGKGLAESGGRENPSILSDALEALFAAMDLDGGFTAAEALITRLILSKDAGLSLTDPKTTLQEIAQKDGRTVTYRLVSESGPEHDRHFVSEALIDGIPYETGEGRSKKLSEIQAAEQTIKRLRNE